MGVEFILSSLLFVVITIFLGTGVGLFIRGVDRKLTAHMQARIGPPLRQPFLDIGKLLEKDTIIPENSIRWLYNLAPIACFASAATLLFYIPFGSLPSFGSSPSTLLGGRGDLVLLAYLLLLPSLALTLGGFTSGSPYATVGAQREMVTMVSYEFPIITGIVALAWEMNKLFPYERTFSLSVFSTHLIWSEVGLVGWIGLALILFVFVLVTTGELAKIPFDVAEAETEIAGGLLAEYSGRNLALFYLGDCIKAVAMGSIIVAIFFPFNLSPWLSLSAWQANLVDLLFFFVKLLLILFFSLMLVRVALARLKINQVVDVQWFSFTLICIIGLLLVWIDPLLSPILGFLGG
jgi:formate hydrogenlyase subunit 4